MHLLGGEEPVALLPGRLGGENIDFAGADLDRNVRFGPEVPLPSRIGRRPSLGGEDHPPSVILVKCERIHVALARLCPDMVEQQQILPLAYTTDAPLVGTEFLDHLSVESK